MTEHVGREFEVSISETLLARVLAAWWAGSGLSEPVRLSPGGWNPFSGSVEARLDAPVPRPRSDEGGQLRLDCRAEIEASYGLATHRNVVFEWTLRVRPRIEVVVRSGDAPPVCQLAADFAAAEIRDLRVATVDRIAGWKFDPGEYDPFSDMRWRELGRIVAKQLLRRVGERRASIPEPLFDALPSRMRKDRESVALRVETHRLRIGWLGPDVVGGRDGAAGDARGGSGDFDGPNPGAAGRESLAVVGLGKRIVEDWIVERVEAQVAAVQVRDLQLVAEAASDRFRLLAAIRPSFSRWPPALRLRIALEGALKWSLDDVGVTIEEIALGRVRLPVRVRERLLRPIRERLERTRLVRRLDLPALTSLSGPLRVESIAYDPGIQRWEIRAAEDDSGPDAMDVRAPGGRRADVQARAAGR